MSCDWCNRSVSASRMGWHKLNDCTANMPLPGFVCDCGGTVVPYDGKTWRCLQCKTSWAVVWTEIAV